MKSYKILVNSFLTLICTFYALAIAMENNINPQVNNAEEKVTLISSQGHNFIIPRICAEQSPVIKAMIKSQMKEGITKSITFKKIDTETLSHVQMLLLAQPIDESRKKILYNLEFQSNLSLDAFISAIDFLDLEELLNQKYVVPIARELSREVLTELVNLGIPCKELKDASCIKSVLIKNNDEIDSASKILDLEYEKKGEKVLAVDKELIFSGYPNGAIRIWDKLTRSPIEEIKHPALIEPAVRSITIDGDLIVSKYSDKSILICNKYTGKILRYINRGYHYLGGSPIIVVDGMIFSGEDDGRITIWDMHYGEKIAELKGHTGSTMLLIADQDMIISQDVEISRTIKTIAIGKRNTKQWDIGAFKKFNQFINHGLPFYYVALLNKLHLGKIKKITLTNQEKELLQHFLETIKDNWGESIMEVVHAKLINNPYQCNVM